jgi:hypothetical protein
MRIRQIALVARDLASVRQQLFALLGLDADYADPGVGTFGLHNSVMTIGDTFLEVVSPVADNTTAQRLLARRGGDGGYMVITQVDNLDAVASRVARLGVRKIWEIDLPGEAKAFHLHPKDVPGAICSFDEMTPPPAWKWAGPNWQDRRAAHVTTIAAATIQCEDPQTVAAKWAAVFDLPVDSRGSALSLQLDEGEIRFVQATDGRGDGLSGLDLVTNNWAAVASAADRMKMPRSGRSIEACGVHFKFTRAI